MNRVILVGRITKDPELRRTNSDIPYCFFTLAVNRRYHNKNGEKQTDFINCVAWRQTAELLARYITKGSQIGVEGQIQTRTYDEPTGNRRYITEVVCDSITFLDTRRQADRDSFRQDYGQFDNYFDNYNDNNKENKNHEDPFLDIDTDISSDDLPF